MALVRIVVANHERIIALEPFYKSFLGTTLRYDYELCPQVCRLSAACVRMQTTILARSAA